MALSERFSGRLVYILVLITAACFALSIHRMWWQTKSLETVHSDYLVIMAHRTSDATDADRGGVGREDIFTYSEEAPAGTGTYGEEMDRLRRHLATQGAVCVDIRRIGGAQPKPPKPRRQHEPDGAWEVCFDKEMRLNRQGCNVYSFGIADEWSFDEAMEAYGCQVFSFDPSMGFDDHRHSERVQFYNLGLSDVNRERNSKLEGKPGWKTRNLISIIKQLGHEKEEIDVLKMDIEWDEWKCLPQMLMDGTLRRFVRQLNVEYHVVDKTSEGVRRYYSISKWLQRQGFKIVNRHKNVYCPECFEMTYVNTELVKLP